MSVSLMCLAETQGAPSLTTLEFHRCMGQLEGVFPCPGFVRQVLVHITPHLMSLGKQQLTMSASCTEISDVRVLSSNCQDLKCSVSI